MNEQYSPSTLAGDHIKLMEACLNALNASPDNWPWQSRELMEALLQLKTAAAAQELAQIRNIANILLGFLEGIEQPDAQIMEILSVHIMALKAILPLSADEQEKAQLLEDELRRACARYKLRHPS